MLPRFRRTPSVSPSRVAVVLVAAVLALSGALSPAAARAPEVGGRSAAGPHVRWTPLPVGSRPEVLLLSHAPTTGQPVVLRIKIAVRDPLDGWMVEHRVAGRWKVVRRVRSFLNLHATVLVSPHSVGTHRYRVRLQDTRHRSTPLPVRVEAPPRVVVVPTWRVSTISPTRAVLSGRVLGPRDPGTRVHIEALVDGRWTYTLASPVPLTGSGEFTLETSPPQVAPTLRVCTDGPRRSDAYAYVARACSPAMSPTDRVVVPLRVDGPTVRLAPTDGQVRKRLRVDLVRGTLVTLDASERSGLTTAIYGPDDTVLFDSTHLFVPVTGTYTIDAVWAMDLPVTVQVRTIPFVRAILDGPPVPLPVGAWPGLVRVAGAEHTWFDVESDAPCDWGSRRWFDTSDDVLLRPTGCTQEARASVRIVRAPVQVMTEPSSRVVDLPRPGGISVVDLGSSPVARLVTSVGPGVRSTNHLLLDGRGPSEGAQFAAIPRYLLAGYHYTVVLKNTGTSPTSATVTLSAAE